MKATTKIAGKEGICPVCNSDHLEYFDTKFLDGGWVTHWKCLGCGSHGEEGFDNVFDGMHYCIRLGNGKSIGEESRTGKEDVCPICGHQGLDYYDDDYMESVYLWKCPACKGSGAEGYDRVFDGFHYNVMTSDGKLFDPQK